MVERNGTILFTDLVAFSKRRDPIQLDIEKSFYRKLRELLTELWGTPPRRSNKNYFILPTGDGAAIILWKGVKVHPQREYDALWLAGNLLVWANTKIPRIGLRCGINLGILDPVKDPYNLTNVCGLAITVAQRIMDAAQPGQLLVHKDFTQRLDINKQGKDFKYNLDLEEYEILAKHNEIIRVKNVTGKIIKQRREYLFGKPGSPANKWHLQIEPPILHLDKYGIKPIKTPPEELLEKHKNIAFVGATNDQLADIILKVVKNNPSKKWESIAIYFLKDNFLKWMETEERSQKILLEDKQAAIKNLRKALSDHVLHLEFWEFNQPFYFASYWDWNEPGGRIHISPYIWGADVRKCPALDYTWMTKQPTPQYQAYREGLQHLRRRAKPIRMI